MTRPAERSIVLTAATVIKAVKVCVGVYRSTVGSTFVIVEFRTRVAGLRVLVSVEKTVVVPVMLYEVLEA